MNPADDLDRIKLLQAAADKVLRISAWLQERLPHESADTPDQTQECLARLFWSAANSLQPKGTHPPMNNAASFDILTRLDSMTNTADTLGENSGSFIRAALLAELDLEPENVRVSKAPETDKAEKAPHTCVVLRCGKQPIGLPSVEAFAQTLRLDRHPNLCAIWALHGSVETIECALVAAQPLRSIDVRAVLIDGESLSAGYFAKLCLGVVEGVSYLMHLYETGQMNTTPSCPSPDSVTIQGGSCKIAEAALGSCWHMRKESLESASPEEADLICNPWPLHCCDKVYLEERRCDLSVDTLMLQKTLAYSVAMIVKSMVRVFGEHLSWTSSLVVNMDKVCVVEWDKRYGLDFVRMCLHRYSRNQDRCISRAKEDKDAQMQTTGSLIKYGRDTPQRNEIVAQEVHQIRRQAESIEAKLSQLQHLFMPTPVMYPYIISGGGDATIRLWSPMAQETLKVALDGDHSDAHCLGTVKDTETSGGSILGLCRAGADLLVSCGDDRRIRVWEKKKPLRKTERESEQEAGASPTNWTQKAETVALLQVRHRMEGHTGFVNSVTSISRRKADYLIASGADDGTIKIWDAGYGRLIRSLDEGGHGSVLSVCNGTDDDSLISAAGSCISVWDVETGQCEIRLRGHTGDVYGVCAIKSGGLASSLSATAAQKAGVHPFSAATGGLGADLNVDLCSLRLVASCSGEPCGADNTVRIWDVASGRPAHILRGHASWVCCVTHVGENMVASAGYDKVVRLWDLRNPSAPLANLHGHTGWVHAVMPYRWAGRAWLVSAARDHTVRLWDVESQTPIAIWRGHSRTVHALTRL